MYSVCYSLDVLINDLPIIPKEDREMVESSISHLLLRDPITYSSEIKGSVYRKFKVEGYVVLFSYLNLDKALLILAIKNLELIV